MLNDLIPEEDKVCINCDFFGRQNEGAEERLCCGTMPCLNYHKDNTENFFKPDDLYLQDTFGCEACMHYACGDPAEECGNCSRYYSDYWERRIS